MFWHNANKELPDHDGEYLVVEDDYKNTKSVVNFAERLELGSDRAKAIKYNVFYTYDSEMGHRFKNVKQWTELD